MAGESNEAGHEFSDGVEKCIKRIGEGKLAIDAACMRELVRAYRAQAVRYVQAYCIMADSQPSYLRMATVVAAAIRAEFGDDAPLKQVVQLAEALGVEDSLRSIGVFESLDAAAAEPRQRAAAREWWKQGEKTEATCDECRGSLRRGDGYLVSGRGIMIGDKRIEFGDELLCANCFGKAR